MIEWDSSISASLIRWIAILPFVSAVVHGLLIGLVRAKLSDRSIWAISLSAIAVAFGLSALTVFDLVGSASGQPILDTLGPWIGGGVGPRSFSAELTFQFDPLSAVFCLAVTSIALAVYVYTVGLLRSGSVNPQNGHRTFAMLDLLVGGTLVLVLADNLLFLFLGWTVVGIASQLFASFEFEEPHASRAGAVTFVIGRVGDLGLLASILLLYFFVIIGLLDEFDTYPATPKDPALSNPQWFVVVIWLIALYEFIQIGYRLGAIYTDHRPRPGFGQIRTLVFLIIGLLLEPVKPR